MKIVTLYCQSLFTAGVESSLQLIKELEVIHINASETVALDQIRNLAPDVVIVDANDSRLVHVDAIFQVLGPDSAARVISLDLNSKRIDVYLRETRPALTSDDLVAALGDFPSG